MQQRARSLAEIGTIMGRMMSHDDVMASIQAYRPRTSDVIITPSGKCGTTRLQQAFHCLRTRGDTDFEEISCVVPWIETSGALGIDINAAQRAEPRGFKSHLPYEALPPGARYVVSFRDPCDALVSLYRFFEGWVFEPGAVALDDFAQAWLTDMPSGESYWQHLLSWWAQRDNPDVLLLGYEHTGTDPDTTIRALAALAGIALDDALLALTRERMSFAYMNAHREQFNDVLMRQLSERRCDLPPGSDSYKVRAGTVGGHRQELSAAMIDACHAVWRTRVTPVTGLTDYAALDAAVRQRLAGRA